MQIDQHILIRYFLKQASEEEKEVIRQWIESSEDNRRRFIRAVFKSGRFDFDFIGKFLSV